jgi:imidazoleglycerol phosphate dehydratase HisB
MCRLSRLTKETEMKVYIVVDTKGIQISNTSTGTRFFSRELDALRLKNKYNLTKDIKKVLEYDLSKITPVEIKEGD